MGKNRKYIKEKYKMKNKRKEKICKKRKGRNKKVKRN
jgi:hypothetical protein